MTTQTNLNFVSSPQTIWLPSPNLKHRDEINIDLISNVILFFFPTTKFSAEISKTRIKLEVEPEVSSYIQFEKRLTGGVEQREKQTK